SHRPGSGAELRHHAAGQCGCCRCARSASAARRRPPGFRGGVQCVGIAASADLSDTDEKMAPQVRGPEWYVRLKAETTLDMQTAVAVADRLDLGDGEFAHRQQKVRSRI